MSWSLSLSGHVEGEGAAEAEATILAAAKEIAASSGGTGSFSGQHTGYTQLPAVEAQAETIPGADGADDAPAEKTDADAEDTATE